MSCQEHAHLAYGYFLFDSQEWKIIEAEEWYRLVPPWLDETDISRSIHRKLLLADGMTEEEHYEKRHREERLLMERRNLGLNLFGHWEQGGCAYFLHAGTVQEASAYEPLAVGLDKPERADENLDWALSVLGITPNQGKAQWMIYPSYK